MVENSGANQRPKEQPPRLRSTRIETTEAIPFDPLKPRLGRRESEPHSEEISYIYEVLHLNFPTSRTTWDLHHYFTLESGQIDIQFDISFFKDLKIDYTLSAYHASKFNNRVPDMAINFLSKSTWQMDVGIHVDYSRLLKIPLYIVFSPYYIGKEIYKPPFLRAYILHPDGDYHIQNLKKISLKEGNTSIDRDALLKVSNLVPFNLGIMELAYKHEGDLPRYRLILVNPETGEIFPTQAEQEKVRADQEKARADQEKARADQEKARADQEKARADQEKARADQEKARADQLQNELKQYHKKV
ncbi:MAG: cell envelope integrity protein TolA [Candidatus Helarchaeota archaeon]